MGELHLQAACHVCVLQLRSVLLKEPNETYRVVRKGPSMDATVETKMSTTASSDSITLMSFVSSARKLELSMPSIEIMCCCCCCSSILVICSNNRNNSRQATCVRNNRV